MKKVLFSILIMVISVLVSSCLGIPKLGGMEMVYENDTQLMYRMGETIIKFINSNNTDGLLNMFSQEAKSQASLLEEQIQQMFNYIDGEIALEDKGAGAISGEYGTGDETIDVRYRGVCRSSTGRLYDIGVVQYRKSENKSKNGVFCITVVETKYRTALNIGPYNDVPPGIYFPSEEDVLHAESVMSEKENQDWVDLLESKYGPH